MLGDMHTAGVSPGRAGSPCPRPAGRLSTPLRPSGAPRPTARPLDGIGERDDGAPAGLPATTAPATGRGASADEMHHVRDSAGCALYESGLRRPWQRTPGRCVCLLCHACPHHPPLGAAADIAPGFYLIRHWAWRGLRQRRGAVGRPITRGGTGAAALPAWTTCGGTSTPGETRATRVAFRELWRKNPKRSESDAENCIITKIISTTITHDRVRYRRERHIQGGAGAVGAVGGVSQSPESSPTGAVGYLGCAALRRWGEAGGIHEEAPVGGTPKAPVGAVRTTAKKVDPTTIDEYSFKMCPQGTWGLCSNGAKTWDVSLESL